MKSPIFLLSLPRSGSTLLQKVLMNHNDIASVSEPWIMLPLSYIYKKEGVSMEYSHDISFNAISDFIKSLPNEESDYFEALATFAETLYDKHCLNDEIYFLDKTPRYYNIIPQITKAFPDAKFIFLFRNPVHVMSSMIETWGNGNLRRLYSNERDLNYGPKALSDGYELLKNKAYSLQYEKYVTDPSKYTKEICTYLNIDFDEKMLNNFSNQNMKGGLGDPTGKKEHDSISAKSLSKWKNTFRTNFRKKIIHNYINSIDFKTLEIQGYSKKNILEDIQKLNVSNKYFFIDRIDYLYSLLIKIYRANIILEKIKKLG